MRLEWVVLYEPFSKEIQRESCHSVCRHDVHRNRAKLLLVDRVPLEKGGPVSQSVLEQVAARLQISGRNDMQVGRQDHSAKLEFRL